MKALVTGANGFIGRAMCQELARRKIEVRAAVRSPSTPANDLVGIGDMGPDTDWTAALAGVEVVFHIAGLAHLRSLSNADHARLRRTNVAGTLALAAAVKASPIKRFVYLSTAKVHGETSGARPFRESDPPAPSNPYAAAKLDAERGVRDILGARAVIVRSPLVYGPGVKANFLSLMRAVDRHWPLPFGLVHNERNVVFVHNLTAAMAHLAADDRAEGEAFFVSDAERMSTPDLIRRIGEALDRKPVLVPMPPSLLRALGSLLRLRPAVEKVIGSFALDTSRIASLGWSPPYSVREGLAETGAWYRKQA